MSEPTDPPADPTPNPDPEPQPPPMDPIPSGEQRPEWLPEKFWNAKEGKAEYDKLAVSYQHLEKQASKKAAPVKPGADATDEQKAAYYAELRKITGAPEKPEEYGLKAPENLPEGVEWNGELANKAVSIAHKYGVPPEALQELVALNNENIGSLIANSKAAKEAEWEKAQEQLNLEWGEAAKVNWQRANRGAIALGIDTTKSDLARNPEFIKAALAVDKMLREDAGLVAGDPDTATYDEQIARIQKGDDFQGKNGPKKQEEALERLRHLFHAKNAG